MTTNELTGRVLDAAVAERVMGLTLGEPDWPCWRSYDDGSLNPHQIPARARDDDERHPVTITDGYREVVPFFSTDIAAAWQVVERLRLTVGYAGNAGWYAGPGEDGDWDCWSYFAVAQTASEAICRAALAAVESEG